MFSELPLTHVIPVPGCKTRFPILHTAVSRPSCFAPDPEEKLYTIQSYTIKATLCWVTSLFGRTSWYDENIQSSPDACHRAMIPCTGGNVMGVPTNSVQRFNHQPTKPATRAKTHRVRRYNCSANLMPCRTGAPPSYCL